MRTDYSMKQGKQPWQPITKTDYDYAPYYLKLQGAEKLKETINESPNRITKLIEMVWNGQKFSLCETIYKKNNN